MAVWKLRHAVLQRSLALQVIGVAVLMALLGGGVVGVVVTDRARSVVRDDILSNSLTTADLAATLTADFMDEAESATRELASRPAVQAAIQAGDFSTLNVDLERWIVERPNITVFICDLNGVTRVTGFSNKSSLGQNRADQDWFAGPMTTGQPFLGTPGVSPVTHKARAPYGVPIRDAAGTTRAVLIASIQLDALSNAITAIGTGKNARASLTDLAHGVILANVDPTRILTPAVGQNGAELRLQAGERGVLESSTSSGQLVLAAFGPVPGLPWGIMIEQPSTDAFAPLDELAREVQRLVAASVLLAVALGVALAIRIVRPLQRLRRTAEAMAGGDLDRRAGLDRQDEAGELGRAFDHMADRMQASIRRATESEVAIRAVMDGVADAIVTFDEGGNIDSCNAAAERLFGYAAAEVVGERIGRLLPEAARHASVTEWLAAVSSGQPVASLGYACEGRRRDGASIPLELATSETRVDGRRRLIVVARDLTERMQTEQARQHQALHDDLTGLPNRTLLLDRLSQAIVAAGRASAPVTLLLVDLDRFKEINNTFGHRSGDLLLQQIGPRLRGVLRASDIVARLGGDEFGVVLPGTNTVDAVAVAQQLLCRFEASFEFDTQSFEIGARIGIAGYPAHGSDAAALLREADVAMSMAKQGEASIVVYTAEQDHYSAERLALGGELRRAIDRDELLLHFQPKLDLRTGNLAGVEALVRWQHPQRGFLPPDQFIPLAEQTGLIYVLTRWVLEAALRQHQAWSAMGLDIPVAVNLSRRTLHDPQLPEMVAELLTRWGAAPSGLVLEITESSLMADPVRANDNLAQLRALGVRMSIDDFGTGYSSLASLQNLSVDELKIDRSFVQAMSTDASARAIVRAIIDLADALKLSVVAEGVEDRATWDVLAGLGCDMAQGYFLSRPVEAAELETWVAQVGPAWLQIAARPTLEEALQDRIRERGARLTAEEEFIARKQAEADLRASEERNRLALQAAGMGTWAWDVINGTHAWSVETEILSGLAPGTFDGSFAMFRAAIHPDDWPAFESEEGTALVEGRDSVTTYRVLWPDGSIHWLESNGRGLYAADGTLLRVTGTCLDITERTLAAEALRANEERFRKQYKGFPLPTYSWLRVGDDFVLQDFNDAAEAVTGG
ncbi:MAG TPA: EAL domain-containing protein, partial [Chloroflexota bacterium]|nr:EAL domain-containing protein [Chloroflexota bacterium]